MCKHSHKLFLLPFKHGLHNALRTVIIIILTCAISVAYTFFVTKHIYENKLKYKTEGGYKYEMFNTGTVIDKNNLPIINISKDGYDDVMKNLEQIIFSDKRSYLHSLMILS